VGELGIVGVAVRTWWCRSDQAVTAGQEWARTTLHWSVVEWLSGRFQSKVGQNWGTALAQLTFFNIHKKFPINSTRSKL
jgi:hypothetical protein